MFDEGENPYCSRPLTGWPELKVAWSPDGQFECRRGAAQWRPPEWCTTAPLGGGARA